MIGKESELIEHLKDARSKRCEKLRNNGASPDVVISFMVGANLVINQLEYFFETGELLEDEDGRVDS